MPKNTEFLDEIQFSHVFFTGKMEVSLSRHVKSVTVKGFKSGNHMDRMPLYSILTEQYIIEQKIYIFKKIKKLKKVVDIQK